MLQPHATVPIAGSALHLTAYRSTCLALSGSTARSGPGAALPAPRRRARSRPRLRRPGRASAHSRPAPPGPKAPPRRPARRPIRRRGRPAGPPRPRPGQARRQPMSGRARRPVRAARAEPAQSEKSEPNPSGPPLRTCQPPPPPPPPARLYCPNPKVQFCGPAAASERDDTGVRQVSEARARESRRRRRGALPGAGGTAAAARARPTVRLPGRASGSRRGGDRAGPDGVGAGPSRLFVGSERSPAAGAPRPGPARGRARGVRWTRGVARPGGPGGRSAGGRGAAAAQVRSSRAGTEGEEAPAAPGELEGWQCEWESGCGSARATCITAGN